MGEQKERPRRAWETRGMKAGVKGAQNRRIPFSLSHAFGPLFLTCNFSGPGKIKPNFHKDIWKLIIYKVLEDLQTYSIRERDFIVS